MCAKHAKMCDTCKKKLIDEKLKQCATIFTNLGIDSTDEERRDAYAEEQQLLYEIRALDKEKGDRLLNIE
jgi:ribosome assembly protein YihI (activator of Der GTPase)